MSPQPGLGVYTLSEVARLAELHPSTARSWFRGRSDGSGPGPVLRSDYARVDRDSAFSFLDLVDCFVAGRFRRAGVKMATVRSAYLQLCEDLETPHPFAHSRLYTDGKSIIVSAAGRIRGKLFYDAVSKQLFFDELEDGLERIEYRPDTGLAARWNVASGVLVDPELNFGKPVVADTGTATLIVARQFRANGNDAGLVADLFEISEADVRNAVEFESRFGRLAA